MISAGRGERERGLREHSPLGSRARNPADATESQAQLMRLVHLAPDGWRGELEALVCRGYGHVEWFVADPQTLPVGTDGIVLVTTKPDAPYRDPA